MSMTVSDDFTKTADKPSCLGGHSIPVLNLTHYHTHMATDTHPLLLPQSSPK